MRKLIIAIVSMVLLLGINIAMVNADTDNPFMAIWKAITGPEKQVNELGQEINCLELVKDTPDRGPSEWINIDVRRFFDESLRRYEEIQNNPSDSEEWKTNLMFWEDILNESSLMYDYYLEYCE